MIGKALGMFFGYGLGGPLGLVAGLWLGHAFDTGLRSHLTSPLAREKAQNVFFDLTFQVMGHLAKADGRVNEQEIAVARSIMTHMGLSESQRLRAMKQFNYGKEPFFNLSEALNLFDMTFRGKWPLRQLFMEILIQATYADGQAGPQERSLLNAIATQLKFSPGRLAEMESRFQAEQAFYRGRTHHQQQAPEQAHQAYAVLEIGPGATDGEVKKAYRRQMSQHHPDKLAAKGLPPDMMRMATEKAQAIQKAYAHICQVRQQKNA